MHGVVRRPIRRPPVPMLGCYLRTMVRVITIVLLVACGGSPSTDAGPDAAGRDAAPDTDATDANLGDTALADTLTDASSDAFDGRVDGVDPFRAFPEAEGYGAMALTGCDRDALRLIRVTSLDDSGPGTLRAALDADPIVDGELRVITFAVAGTIELQRSLRITTSCTYVAGQSAPGDGIQIRFAASVPIANVRTGLIIPHTGGLHDIVLRYLRVRIGRAEPARADNVSVQHGERIVLDHLSGAFASDECFSAESDGDGEPLLGLTIQRSIFGAPLSDHAVGSIIGRQGSMSALADGFSVHHNLFAHMTHRNPMLQGSGDTQVISNLIYNWSSRVSRIHEETRAEVLDNYMIPGPRNPSPGRGDFYRFNGRGNPRVRLAGNFAEGYGDVSWNEYERDEINEPVDRAALEMTEPLSPPVAVTITPSVEVETNVLDDVGANASLDCEGNFVPASDALDQRIIRDVREGTGPATNDETTDSPDDYGGFPTLTGTACADDDEDGMPNAYELLHGFDPADASDARRDEDADGYTNLEEYLNASRPR